MSLNDIQEVRVRNPSSAPTMLSDSASPPKNAGNGVLSTGASCHAYLQLRPEYESRGTIAGRSDVRSRCLGEQRLSPAASIAQNFPANGGREGFATTDSQAEVRKVHDHTHTQLSSALHAGLALKAQDTSPWMPRSPESATYILPERFNGQQLWGIPRTTHELDFVIQLHPRPRRDELSFYSPDFF